MHRGCCWQMFSLGEHDGMFEAGSYLRLTDSCITQLKAQGPARACNESKEEEKACSSASASSTRPQVVMWMKAASLQGYLAHKKPPHPRILP